jgi:hypothetical protein
VAAMSAKFNAVFGLLADCADFGWGGTGHIFMKKRKHRLKN